MKNDIKFFIVLTIIGIGLAYLTYNSNQKIMNQKNSNKQSSVKSIELTMETKEVQVSSIAFSLKIKCMLEE